MAWDPALLRKYNTTGHFRLLNQLRSELKAHPLTRAADDLAAGIRLRRRGNSGNRSLDLRTQGQGSGRFRRGQNQTPAPQAPQVQDAPAEHQGYDSQDGVNGLSFRDRLNAVDMR